MATSQRVVIATTIVLWTMCSAYGIYSVSKSGTWPSDWPKELEPLRKQSRSLIHQTAAIYEIPFTSREGFESAWPRFLELKSNEAAIVLRRSPCVQLGNTMTAGIRVLSPLTGQSAIPVGTELRSSDFPLDAKTAASLAKVSLTIGPPWPEHIQSASGALPEYVINENGKWSAYHETEADSKHERVRKRFRMKRARLNIELIVDGDIVDLNRIPLPANTPIIDKRFDSGNKR